MAGLSKDKSKDEPERDLASLFRQALHLYRDKGKAPRDLGLWAAWKQRESLERAIQAFHEGTGESKHDPWSILLGHLFNYYFRESPWPFTRDEMPPWPASLPLEEEGRDPLLAFVLGPCLAKTPPELSEDATPLHQFLALTAAPDLLLQRETQATLYSLLEYFYGPMMAQNVPTIMPIVENLLSTGAGPSILDELEGWFSEAVWKGDLAPAEIFFLLLGRLLGRMGLTADPRHPYVLWFIFGSNPLLSSGPGFLAALIPLFRPMHKFVTLWEEALSFWDRDLSSPLPFAERLQLKILRLQLYRHQALQSSGHRRWPWQEIFFREFHRTHLFAQEKCQKVASRLLRYYSKSLALMESFSRDFSNTLTYWEKDPASFNLGLAVYLSAQAPGNEKALKKVKTMLEGIHRFEDVDPLFFVKGMRSRGGKTSSQTALKKLFFDKFGQGEKEKVREEFIQLLFYSAGNHFPEGHREALTIYLQVYGEESLGPLWRILGLLLLKRRTFPQVVLDLAGTSPSSFMEMVQETMGHLNPSVNAIIRDLLESFLLEVFEVCTRGEASPAVTVDLMNQLPRNFFRSHLERCQSLLKDYLIWAVNQKGLALGQIDTLHALILEADKHLASPNKPAFSHHLQETRNRLNYLKTLGQRQQVATTKKAEVQTELFQEGRGP